ncbi:hypothetical protein CDL12_30033 [Handroanthus impetiginosus]|uniref:Large ribosomal subunit protein bL21m n=1 Tax=Handroanthus impetiginosus TaxID=429701 RepID=A0A2G9FWQ9_9LAMI|nr:hypothetical protein CDL12_30033 [Handroanthus impetiginosus]
MANRRCLQTVTRYLQSVKTLTPLSHTLAPTSAQVLHQTLTQKPSHHICGINFDVYRRSSTFTRHFSSKHTGSEDDDDEDDESEGEEGRGEDQSVVKSAEDKEKEAAEIGYKVIGPLQQSDRVLKAYETVFSVVQLVLNKVLMLGSKTQTIIGRPFLPDAAVHAVVEEHALDAKVIIFKKKRRKNYRRTKGHRQELTKLRITDIQGIEKSSIIPPSKTEKKDKKEKPQKLAVGA